MVRTSIRNAVILFALLCATAAIYAPVKDAPFVYEDENWIANIQDDVSLVPKPSRVLTHMTFRWTYERVNLAPRVWHLTNVGLHLVNGVLVYAMAASVLGSPVALGAAGLFLLHPLNAEAVSYVTARADLLSTMFILLAILVALGQGWWLARGIACAVLLAAAAQSKEVAVVGAPLVILALACWRRTSIPWLSPLLAGLWVAIGAALGAITPQLLSYASMSPTTSGSFLPVQQYALFQGGMVWKFLIMALWPVGLTIDHDVLLFGQAWLALSAIGIGAALTLAMCIWRWSPSTAWVIGSVAIALAPRFLFRTNEFLNEHQIYTAFAWVWIAVAVVIDRAWRSMRLIDSGFWRLYEMETTASLKENSMVEAKQW